MSKREGVVALSNTEVEYMLSTHGSKESMWFQRLCSSIGFVQKEPRIGCQRSSAFFLAKNPSYHSNTKQIDVQIHFVKDMLDQEKVLLEKLVNLKYVAYSLEKYVSTAKFSWCRESTSIVSPFVTFLSIIRPTEGIFTDYEFLNFTPCHNMKQIKNKMCVQKHKYKYIVELNSIHTHIMHIPA